MIEIDVSTTLNGVLPNSGDDCGGSVELRMLEVLLSKQVTWSTVDRRQIHSQSDISLAGLTQFEFEVIILSLIRNINILHGLIFQNRVYKFANATQNLGA